MKEFESVGIAGAPKVSLKGPVLILPECDIVKGCAGRSSIESFEYHIGKGCGCVICDAYQGLCLVPRIDCAFG